MRRRYRNTQSKCFAVDAPDSDRDRNTRLSIDRACVHPGDNRATLAQEELIGFWYGDARRQLRAERHLGVHELPRSEIAQHYDLIGACHETRRFFVELARVAAAKR